MAGEYYRWLARNEKPEEKRELTAKEKRKNWWYYHKWYVLGGVLAAVCLAGLVGSIIKNKTNQPDYTIAYVGSYSLPDGTVEQLAAALAELGEDLNQNGKVTVEICQYLVYAGEDGNTQVNGDSEALAYAGRVQLMANLENCESLLFLLEDPQRFQADFQILSRIDGSLPEEDPDSEVPLYVAWTDCPVLTGLPLETYTVELPEDTIAISNQTLLSGLYLARRGFWDDRTMDNLEGCTAFWNRLLEGALE